MPVRHPGRWIFGGLVLVLLGILLHSVITNPNFQWPVVGEYLFEESVLNGLKNTLVITALAMVIGVLGGLVLAVMRRSPNPVLSWTASGYIWLFRGTPLITQLLFWNYLGALYPKLGLGIPFGPTFVGADTNVLISSFAAALLGLGLNEAAYMAEIVRGGLLSVDEGQSEAASALGMSRGKTLRRVVLPQAMRMIIPPTGNQTIAMLKTTSLLMVIAYFELMTSVQQIYSRNFNPIPLLIAAAFWYLVFTTIFTLIQTRIERHFARGSASGPATTPRSEKWSRRMFGFRIGGGAGRGGENV